MPDSPQTEPNKQNTKTDKNNLTRRYLRRIVSWTVRAYVALFILSFWWPNLAERTKFFIGSGLLLALLIVAIAQVLIYYGQQQIMRAQLDAMKEQATVLQGSLEETRKLVGQNERAVIAAEQGAQTAAQTMKVSQRAYVGVTKVTLNRPVRHFNEATIWIFIENKGLTPARNITIRSYRGYSNITVDEFSYDPLPDLPSQAVLLPGSKAEATMQTASFPEAFRESYFKQGHRLYIWGIIEYDDVFGDHHRTLFCYFNLSPDNTALHLHSSHNMLE